MFTVVDSVVGFQNKRRIYGVYETIEKARARAKTSVSALVVEGELEGDFVWGDVILVGIMPDGTKYRIPA
jgi:hypothetical protein